MRRYLIPIMTLAFFMLACSGEKIQEATYPKDLAGKKKLLREKKAELKSLNQDIEKLVVEIDQLDTNNREKSRRLVTTKKIERKDFKRFVDIQATVAADDMVGASSETGGRIITLNAKEGQYVKKGALIAKVDMQSVDKQIAELKKSLELANELHNRQKRLWDQNIGSEVQYLQAKNNKERIEKSLETVSFQLTKANVYAPISGVIEMVVSNNGEMAMPGAPIVQILNTSKVKVVADLPENYLGAIKKGEMVTIKFPALDKEQKARVSMIGRTINPANRTFKVEVNVNNGSGMLKPNLLASMLVSDFQEKDVVVVPLELIQQEVSGKSYVYVKEEGKEGAQAQKKYIEMGESFEGEVIITKGLEGTEELIVEGARGLAENELIEVKTITPQNNG